MVGMVSYLGKVKQGNYHTHVLYTIPNPNYTLPKPCPFIIIYPIHHPTLGTQTGRVLPCASINTPYPYLSLSFLSDTLPEYLPYPTNRRKNTPPYIEYLRHQSHLSVHTCTHLTLPFITNPNLHFSILYYCQGLIKYKAERSTKLGRNYPGPKRLRPRRPRPKRLRAEMTQV